MLLTQRVPHWTKMHQVHLDHRIDPRLPMKISVMSVTLTTIITLVQNGSSVFSVWSGSVVIAMEENMMLTLPVQIARRATFEPPFCT